MEKTRILIVEDERVVSEDIKKSLQQLGYDISAIVPTGEEALQKVEELRPDLVIMDIVLQGKINGIETAERIRSCFNIPVIYLTAYDDEQTLKRVKTTEPFGYIIKPFDERELKIAIEMALHKDKIEKKLKASEQWLTTTLKSIGDAVIATDIKGQITFMNPVAEALTGWDQEEALGKNILEVFRIQGIEKESMDQSRISRALSESIVVKFATPSTLIARDGTEVLIEDSVAPIIDEKANTYGVVLIFRDIAEHTQAKKLLQQSEEKYRMLIENANEGIVVIQNGMLQFINPKFIEIMGYSKKQLMSKSFVEFIHPDDRELVAARYFKRLKDEGPSGVYPFRIMNKAGELRWLEINAVLITWKNSPAILNFFNDITERKNAENEKGKLEKQLLQSQKMEAVGRLAGAIAHDFNNLLTAIIGNTEIMLFDLEAGEPMRPDLEQIKKAADRATSLTRQLLAYSRRQPLDRKVVNLNSIVKKMEEMLHRLLGENILLITTLAPTLDCVKADPGQIEQVIMNLLLNARDAMTEGGKLNIRTKNIIIDKSYCEFFPYARPGKFVCLTVEDTGTGISNTIMNRIFEPFFSTKEPVVGTGLGLSVVYGIVKQHEGWINVVSEPGQGAIFRTYLPAFLIEFEDQITPQPVLTASPKGKGERILLVEDEETVSDFTVKVLRENGYQVFDATNAKDALEIFNREMGNFQLLFIDVILPDCNGIQLAEQLLTLRPEIKVLLTSGFMDEKSQWSIKHEKGFSYLQKPYTSPDILLAVRKSLK